MDAGEGAIGPLISKSSPSRCSKAARFADDPSVDVGGAGGTGRGRGFDDDDDDDEEGTSVTVTAAAAADTRVALEDCGVVVVVEADFLDGAGRAFVG